MLAAFAKGPIDVLKASSTPLRNVIAFQIPSVTSEVETGPGIHDFNGSSAQQRNPNPMPTSGVRRADAAVHRGTAGLSKGCVLTNDNLVSIAYQESYWMAR